MKCQISSALQIKSILKPTVPLTPPQVIPSFDETRKRKRSAGRSGTKSPKNDGGEELLIDFSTPATSHAVITATGAENVYDPFSSVKKAAGLDCATPAVRTEGNQEAVAGETYAEELRRAQKQAILDQRAARRKSMANRRVSFAPEATLHTWNVIEMVEDSTNSSASNSTKRQSSIAAARTPNESKQKLVPEYDKGEPPSTPPEQVVEPLVKASPADQRGLHQQRRRRRSSAVSNTPLDGADRNEASPSSSYSGSSAIGDSSPIHVEDSVHSSSDDDGDTAMSMDDTTEQTVRSVISSSSTGSSLDDRLRRAAAEAGTRGIEYDENSVDLSMELVGGTITSAFKPWAKAPAQNNIAIHDRQNTQSEEDSDGLPMELAEGEVTSAFQAWVNGGPQSPAQGDSAIQDREAIANNEDGDDLSMELAESTITKAFVPWFKGDPQLPAKDDSAVQDQRTIKHNESGDDIAMELADSTITHAFQSWIGDDPQVSTQENSAIQDQENIKPSSPAVRSEADVVEADNVLKAVDVSVPEDIPEQETAKISLQEFLNMTKIHFMELSTTKRRHTLAPAAPSRPSQEGLFTSSGACFAAAATTLPLLELYQHATRELKSYISTGRNVIQSIEQATMEEQPALFGEYVDARPDVKMVMDNQFRNGKANARLQSKEGWYAWRRQLIEGLRGGLDGIKAGMEEDARSLTRQETILQDTVPDLVKNLGELEQQSRMLEQRSKDYDTIDHESLNSARGQLESADEEVAQKMILLGQLQQRIADKAEVLSAAGELKAEFQGQIAEAERVQDECRGWKIEDVKAMQERVKTMAEASGWALVTAEHEIEEGNNDFGPALTMRYRNALRLFFYPAAFQQRPSEQTGRRRSRRSKIDSGPSAPVSLTYDPVQADAATSATLTTQQRFFLQLLQGQLHALAVLPRGSVSAKNLLTLVRVGWNLAIKVSEEIRLLEIAGITHVSIVSDEKLGARCMLMLAEKCRVDVQFTLTANATNDGSITIGIMVEATPTYGSITALLAGAKASKVREALNKQTTSKAIGEGAWVAAVRGLEHWVEVQKKDTNKGNQNAKKAVLKPTPASVPVATVPQVDTPTPAPSVQKRALRKPVPMEEVMEEAAARQEELRRQEEEEMLMSASKTPAAHGRRPGALRRSP